MRRNSRSIRSAGLARSAGAIIGNKDKNGATTMTTSSKCQTSRMNIRRSVDNANFTPNSSPKMPTINQFTASHAVSIPVGKPNSNGATPALIAASARKPMTDSFSKSDSRFSMWTMTASLITC